MTRLAGKVPLFTVVAAVSDGQPHNVSGDKVHRATVCAMTTAESVRARARIPDTVAWGLSVSVLRRSVGVAPTCRRCGPCQALSDGSCTSSRKRRPPVNTRWADLPSTQPIWLPV